MNRPAQVPTTSLTLFRRAAWLCLLGILFSLVAPLPACSQEPPATSESRDNAWWTGPMLANSAETLPTGHILAEPYLYDISSRGSDSFGSRTYLQYGLANDFTVGVIPVFDYNRVSGGPDSDGVQLGDTTFSAQYRLHRFQEGSWVPTVALQLQETVPTGRYDQLGNRPANGMGAGVYTTSIGINTQTYLWLPNGRILRVRFNVWANFSGRTNLHGVSVYGTGMGFSGNVRPGNSYSADTAFEYSLTRRWVLALDLLFTHNCNTVVSGNTTDPGGEPFPQGVRTHSGSSNAVGFAPALEYSWTPNIGVLLGTRVILDGHGTTGSITPAIALNYVH
ncbi:transporter [Dyella sp. C9]|uniref:transporter n=1 Tax=Dyella sp. C9 TaxID=2202154 RepID=UPI000DEECA65|nr:transporter [Dyella sp. C9]